jgi:hypothetical protein
VQDVSQRYLDAVRSSHNRLTKAVHHNLTTGVATELPIIGGNGVTIDRTSPPIRRTLDLQLQPLESLFEILQAPGAEIVLTSAVQYVDGSQEVVPEGVFIVDGEQIGYAPGDNIALTCPDRMLKIQRNNFGLNRSSVPRNMQWQEIQRLVEDCWGTAFPFPGWSFLDQSATDKVGSLTWSDGNRWNAIAQMLTDNALELFPDANGLFVLQQIPLLTDDSVPVTTVDARPGGMLLDATRTRDMSGVYNAVILTTSATDVTFPPVEVKYVDYGDPQSTTGPLGYVPLYYSSPTLRNSAQARKAGGPLLRKGLSAGKQVTATAQPNNALDASDVVLFHYPTTDPSVPSPPDELQILDSVTLPILATDSQTLTGASTRPDTGND